MKVLIADDHALFRDGLSLHLEQIDPQAVIFQAGNFSQAMKIIDDEKKLDLIIIDRYAGHGLGRSPERD